MIAASAWHRKCQRAGHRYWVASPEPDPALLHRAQAFARLRGVLAGMGIHVAADAVSQAGLSFLGGAPRSPNLRPGAGPEYSTVRIAEGQYSYTMVTLERLACSRCGRATLERHRMELHHEVSGVEQLGYVEGCSFCDAEGWMFKSHMPSVVAARKLAGKVVP